MYINYIDLQSYTVIIPKVNINLYDYSYIYLCNVGIARYINVESGNIR